MKKITEIILWLVVIAILGTLIIYILLYPPGQEFWKNVVGGLLSTAAALIGGIPFALWIDRTIKNHEELKTKKQERKKEIELLELLKEELNFTNNSLDGRKEITNALPVQPLKSDLWSAITAAGKLNLITNHRLLNRIASAYYVINVVRNIEALTYKAIHGATVKYPDGTTAAQTLLENARSFDKLLTDSISEAIREIDEEMAVEVVVGRVKRSEPDKEE